MLQVATRFFSHTVSFMSRFAESWKSVPELFSLKCS